MLQYGIIIWMIVKVSVKYDKIIIIFKTIIKFKNCIMAFNIKKNLYYYIK